MTLINNYQQATARLKKYIPVAIINEPYTLDKMTALMNYLGNPQDKIKVIHIAGTSGKTSTAYYAAALLSAAGHSVGLTVSPHVNNIGDRAQINLELLDEQEYCKLLGHFLDLVESSNINPSYFEVLAGFAFWLFHQKGLDYAVIEVGLGGLLDGTNVINNNNKICIITDIGIDHIRLLGNTISQIAYQKAGIIKPKNSVFIYHQSSDVIAQVEAKCDKEKADLHIVKSIDKDKNLEKLPLFQQRNIYLAIQAVNYTLQRDDDKILTNRQIQIATTTIIPGRMEVVSYHNKNIILDGSHNEQKISALVAAIKQSYPNRNVALMVSFGNSEKSNMTTKMTLLRQLGSTIIITKFTKGQDEIRISVRPEVLATAAEQAGFTNIIIEENPIKALRILVEKSTDIGLITGSFYLLGAVREVVLKK